MGTGLRALTFRLQRSFAPIIVWITQNAKTKCTKIGCRGKRVPTPHEGVFECALVAEDRLGMELGLPGKRAGRCRGRAHLVITLRNRPKSRGDQILIVRAISVSRQNGRHRADECRPNRHPRRRNVRVPGLIERQWGQTCRTTPHRGARQLLLGHLTGRQRGKSGSIPIRRRTGPKKESLPFRRRTDPPN